MDYIKKFLLYGIPMAIEFIVSELIGNFTHLYLDVAYFDKFMHTIGGILTTYLGYKYLEFLESRGHLKVKSHVVRVFLVISFMFFVAVTWEWYEYIKDVVYSTSWQRDGYDILGDLFFDFTGSIIFMTAIYFKSGKE